MNEARIRMMLQNLFPKGGREETPMDSGFHTALGVEIRERRGSLSPELLAEIMKIENNIRVRGIPFGFFSEPGVEGDPLEDGLPDEGF